MPLSPRHLAVLGGGVARGGPPRFTARELSYDPPNADRSRKGCGNCVFWRGDMRCLLHAADVVVPDSAVCNYYLHGQPGSAEGAVSLVNASALEPETSGLMSAPGGASCDGCRWYEPRGATEGVCAALASEDDPEMDLQVEALGCCNAYTPPE